MTDERERALDGFLVASARLGDRLALGRLAERWQRRLLGHAFRLTGEAELAADVAQEAWVDILGGIARLDDAAAFPAWAFRIVTRCCARAIRRRQRRRRGDSALAGEPVPQSDAARGMEDGADLATVKAAMTELPAGQRAALALFYLEDMRIAEIAVALDVAPGTIKTRLMHARNKLRNRLGGNGS